MESGVFCRSESITLISIRMKEGKVNAYNTTYMQIKTLMGMVELSV